MKESIMAFVEKHKEAWKFIKFIFTGLSTSILQLAVQLFLLYVVFAGPKFSQPLTDNSFFAFLKIDYLGYAYSYFISAVIGYAAAYIMNRKITFKSDANPVVSTILYFIMVVCTIFITTWMGGFFGTLLKNNGWNNVFTDGVLSFVIMQIPVLWTYPLSRFVIHRKKKED